MQKFQGFMTVRPGFAEIRIGPLVRVVPADHHPARAGPSRGRPKGLPMRILASLLLVAVAGSPLLAADPRTFACEVITARQLTDDGTLAESAYAGMLLRDGLRLTFEEKTGRLVRELPSGPLSPRTFIVLQRGDATSDLVARLTSGARNAGPHDMLRIRVAAPSMPFVYLESDVVVTGTCATD